MPKKIPSYRQRKGYDQAIVTLTDAVTKERRDYWLGTFGTAESREAYHRLIAEWEANDRVLPAAAPDEASSGPRSITVEEVMAPYWKWAQGYYAPGECKCIQMALGLLRKMYGTMPATAFGPKSLRLLREQMIRGDQTTTPPRKPWVRTFANRQAHRIAAIFKWAAGQELVPASVYHQLKALEPLKLGRTDAREPEPVRPVPDSLVNPLQHHISPQAWAIIQLQRLTGARCGELFKLRPIDLNMDKTDVWTFSPEAHKTAHHGKKRTIYFGPKAQSVIEPYMAGRPVNHYLFSPAEAEEKRRETLHALRKTPLSCGNRPGTNISAHPSRTPGDHYTTDSYRRAIARACSAAFPPPAHLSRIKVKAKKGIRWDGKAEWKKRLGAERLAEMRRWVRIPLVRQALVSLRVRRGLNRDCQDVAIAAGYAHIRDATDNDRENLFVIVGLDLYEHTVDPTTHRRGG